MGAKIQQNIYLVWKHISIFAKMSATGICDNTCNNMYLLNPLLRHAHDYLHSLVLLSHLG